MTLTFWYLAELAEQPIHILNRRAASARHAAAAQPSIRLSLRRSAGVIDWIIASTRIAPRRA
jgi:hypothetical protein